jgi:hypothetical protein
MSVVVDFRVFTTLHPDKAKDTGDFVGHSVYSKLYFIENVLRVVVHSILSAQISPSWWEIAVGAKMRKKVQEVRDEYLSSPEGTNPGRHIIYYVYLGQLGEIIRTNSNQFSQLIPDIDRWVVNLERIRWPRNVVAHMNFPRKRDRDLIDRVFSDCKALVKSLEDSKQLELIIPEV